MLCNPILQTIQKNLKVLLFLSISGVTNLRQFKRKPGCQKAAAYHFLKGKPANSVIAFENLCLCAEHRVPPRQPTPSRRLLQPVTGNQLEFCHLLRSKYGHLILIPIFTWLHKLYSPVSSENQALKLARGGKKSVSWDKTGDAFKLYTNFRCFVIWLIAA